MFNFSYLLLFWWFNTLKEEIYTKYNLQNLKAETFGKNIP